MHREVLIEIYPWFNAPGRRAIEPNPSWSGHSKCERLAFKSFLNTEVIDQIIDELHVLARISLSIVFSQLGRLLYGFWYFVIRNLPTQRILWLIPWWLIYCLIWGRSVTSSISLVTLGRTWCFFLLYWFFDLGVSIFLDAVNLRRNAWVLLEMTS